MASVPVVHRPYSALVLAQAINQQFYRWDYRLRGYDLFEYPVHPEPVYIPAHYYAAPLSAVVDDGRHETLLSSLARLFKPSKPVTSIAGDAIEEPLPDLYIPTGEQLEFQVVMRKDTNDDARRIAHFLQSLQGLQYPVSFELIATGSYIIVQWSCQAADQLLFESQLTAFFPQVVVMHQTDTLRHAWTQANDIGDVVDFGLNAEAGLSIMTWADSSRHGVDPYTSLIGTLETVSENQCAVFQIIFTPVQSAWSSELVNAVTDADGSCIFADAPQLQLATVAKASSPLFAVVARIGATTASMQATQSLLQRMVSALALFDQPQQNQLLPLSNADYPCAVHIEDLLLRISHRTGMLLSLPELASLVHLPSPSIQSAKLITHNAKTNLCPSSVLGHDLTLGLNHHLDQQKVVSLSREQRMRHTYLIGASGTGKSTLLLHMLMQDINHGEGLALLDPHGDLIDDVLRRMPQERQQDVIVLDPSDEDFPVGFNLLHAHSEAEKSLLASDLTTVFRRFSESWGDRMQAILANGIMAMLEHPDGGTLLTLRRFLTDKAFRLQYLAAIADPEIRYYWEKEYPLYTGRPEASVLVRLDTFLRAKTIRHMVAQPKSSIDFSEVMDTRKILLIKLSQGAIGQENAYLLGSLMVSAIHQAALRRQSQDKAARVPFYLYLDEFQHFVTESMAEILSGVRKYNLGLTLAHQERRQLLSKDREVASSVLSNAYTQICFRLGYEDAGTMAKGLSTFDAHDLQNLGIGQAIVRTEQAQYDFNLMVPSLPEPPLDDYSDEIVQQSQQRYGKPKAEVEAAILALYPSHAATTETRKTTQPTPPKKPSLEKESVVSAQVEEAAVSQTAEAVEEVSDKVVEDVAPTEQSKAKSLGRGGTQHSYLQNLIKKYAEERGFKATIEAQVLGGSGFVDVGLQLKKLKIACEISVTTEVEYEVQNIQKCVAAGYGQVVVIANQKAKLDKLQKAAKEALEVNVLKRVHFLMPEAFLAYLETLIAKHSKPEKSVRGYKVKTRFVEGSEAEKKAKSMAVAKLIAKGMNKT